MPEEQCWLVFCSLYCSSLIVVKELIVEAGRYANVNKINFQVESMIIYGFLS